MNIQLTGVHLDITPAIREHVMTKMERAIKGADNIIGMNIVLSVEKIRHKVEATIQLRGKNLFLEEEDQDLYAAIDLLVDKLNRQLIRHKQKRTDHGHDRIVEHLED